MAKREFRSKESYAAERVSRDALVQFLRASGLRELRDDRKAAGKAQSQTITARTRSGSTITMRVRLAWRRREGHRAIIKTYSAAQLMARVDGDDWEGSMKRRVDKQRADGVTHLLLVERGQSEIISAALIPLSEVLPIWCQQRDISNELIRLGLLGRRHKNHAMNGSSPTLWLRDDRAPSVGSCLWDHPGVVRFTGTPAAQPVIESGPIDDTYQDLAGVDLTLIGRDAGKRRQVLRSYFPRDRKVRATVLRLSRGICEQRDCNEARPYPGFLDVHHILGVEKSDRVENCVALCPNCHREAHFAPDSDGINRALLEVARGRAK